MHVMLHNISIHVSIVKCIFRIRNIYSYCGMGQSILFLSAIFFLLVSTLIRLSANLFNCSVFNFISINWILEICDLICFYIFLIFIFSTFSIVAGCPFYKLSNCFSFKLVGKQKYIYIGWCRSKNNKQKIHE